jgi:hypothetical protein
MARGNSCVRRADEYVVTPTPDGTKKELTTSRKFGRRGKLAEDGLNRKLFPLTTVEQRKHRFQLSGEEVHRGLPVYRITFAPKVIGVSRQ